MIWTERGRVQCLDDVMVGEKEDLVGGERGQKKRRRCGIFFKGVSGLFPLDCV